MAVPFCHSTEAEGIKEEGSFSVISTVAGGIKEEGSFSVISTVAGGIKEEGEVEKSEMAQTLGNTTDLMKTHYKKRDYQFFVYILSSISKVLYIGVSNSLQRRVWEHKNDENDGFSKKYQCHKLVYFEEYQYIDDAISREKQLKKWRREKKCNLVETLNPTWSDLSLGW